MTSAAYIIGIDLGTTNCAVAFANPRDGQAAVVWDFPIAQLERPGQMTARPLLPSCLYAAGPSELPAGSTELPWGPSGKWIVGEFARWQGARVPGRLVSSAKSWLCHEGVDRSAPILPWGAPAEVQRVSPTDATSLLLRHIADAWNHAHPEASMADQEVVITVPASFDEVARALTVTAAQSAGLGKLTLVEEPLAAFYDFTAQHRPHLTEVLRDVRLVLVVDIGGGTTDFSLIRVVATANGPELSRIAVGEHLMLGGDNMDAALARIVEARLVSGGRKLSAMQWTQLVQASRCAKETLLGSQPPERFGISLVGEGSRLLGSTLSAEVQREETERMTLDGFFPECAANDAPRRGARVALQELGLRYAQDPGITRHLAAFLGQHAAVCFSALGETATASERPRPDALLLNGGVFNSAQITRRLLEVVSAWWPGAPTLPTLPHNSLELAVARGAAQYGLARRGLGQRIGGGAAHAFYIGLAAEAGNQAARAVCLIPRGHEEGESVELESLPFELALGQPVQFPLFATTSDRVDRPGDLVTLGEGFRALPPIHTVLKSAGPEKISVPVHLRATITEIGTLELGCVSEQSTECWRLEFDVRTTPVETETSPTELLPRRLGEAEAALERVFGKSPSVEEAKEVRQLGHTLELFIGSRDTWRLPLLRKLWSQLHAGAKSRRRTSDHERAFFQLAGYTLRPGFGYPLDDWRCEQMFPLFAEGLAHRDAPLVWNEFWVMWRRIAGGLGESHQQEIWITLRPHLARRILPHKAKGLPKPKGVQLEGLDEMVRLAASLEQLNPAAKIELGNWIAERLNDLSLASGPWAWALGRLGARELIYGSHHKTVPPGQAAAWLSLLLRVDLRGINGAPFAATQLARMTGDRSRDIDDSLRAAVVDVLQLIDVPARWVQRVREVIVLDAEEEAQALGDRLPMGLRLKH